MTDFITNFNEQVPFASYAENNKFLPLSSSETGRKYALYTYAINPPTLNLTAQSLSIGDIDVSNWNELINETYTDLPLSANVTVTNLSELQISITSLKVDNLNEISAIQVTNLSEISSIQVTNLNSLTGILLSSIVFVQNQISEINSKNILPDSFWVGSSSINSGEVIAYNGTPNLREIEIQNKSNGSIFFMPSAGSTYNDTVNQGLEIFENSFYSSVKDFKSGIAIASVSGGDVRVIGHYIG
jgi:hypothetical protein